MESHLRVGDLLKQARQKQRLELADCAHRTHIAVRYVEALEANRWHDLPSESHRQGFLVIYARFLGVPTNDVMELYHREKKPAAHAAPHADAPATAAAEAKEKNLSDKKAFFSPTGGQWVGILIFLLALTWGLYHTFKGSLSDSQLIAWTRPHQRLSEPRLVVSHPLLRQQKIKIQADASSWMRVTVNKKMLFEGVLPAHSDKEWSGTGPFTITMANVAMLHVFWNDQPVDIVYGSHSGVNSIQIPPR